MKRVYAAPWRLAKGRSLQNEPIYTPNVPGTLYVVATPIGNLEDLTYRAARILAEADLVAAENRRVAARLLQHLDLHPSVVPYNDRNKTRSTGRILSALARDERVALISDAGTPGISDPGQDLVAAAIAAGATVVPIPGPSAVSALLSVAGLRTRSVRIVGFLPRKRGDRRRLLASLANGGEPALAFESPRRLQATLSDCADVLPDASLVIGRELTKLHEEIWRGSAAAALAHFSQPRGEFSLLIAPAATEPQAWSDDQVREALSEHQALGRSRRDASADVAALANRPRRDVYRLWPDPNPGH